MYVPYSGPFHLRDERSDVAGLVYVARLEEASVAAEMEKGSRSEMVLHQSSGYKSRGASECASLKVKTATCTSTDL